MARRALPGPVASSVEALVVFLAVLRAPVSLGRGGFLHDFEWLQRGAAFFCFAGIEAAFVRHGTGMTLRFLASVGTLALLVIAPRMAAAAPSLSAYEAPAGCESADAFRERVAREAVERQELPRYHVRITAQADRFEGSVTVLVPGATHPPTRTIEAETCEDVTRALALAVSLANVAPEAPASAPASLLLPTLSVRPREDALAPPRSPAADVLVAFGASLLADSENRSGAALDVKVVYRRGLLGLGGLAEVGSAVFDYSYAGVGPMAGIFAPGPKWLRAGLLGTAGVHAYWGVDGVGWFGGCPCGSGALPFTGLRGMLGVDVAFVHVGLQAFADADLGRVQGSLVDPDTGARSPYSAGTFRFGGGLALGPKVGL